MEKAAYFGSADRGPVGEGLAAEHVKAAELAEELPARAVVSEDECLPVVSDVLDADDRGAVGELEVEGLEECAGGVGGGGHDDAGGAQFEVHDGAVASGEAGEARVRGRADEGE